MSLDIRLTYQNRDCWRDHLYQALPPSYQGMSYHSSPIEENQKNIRCGLSRDPLCIYICTSTRGKPSECSQCWVTLQTLTMGRRDCSICSSSYP